MSLSPEGHRLPDLIVIGAMKAASSTICAYFEDHPDVFMVPRGEPEFFSRDDRYREGFEAYSRHFAPAGSEKYWAEGSNSYTQSAMFPDCVARLAQACPEARLVYMVRHSIKRIVSAWIQNRIDMGEQIPADLDEAVAVMPERFVDTNL